MACLNNILQQIKAMGRPSLLITYGGTRRDIAGGSNTLVYHIPQTAALPAVLPRASDYLLKSAFEADGGVGPVPGLDNAMVQNWEDNAAMVSALSQIPDAQALLKAVYGPDYRLVIERFGEQKPSTRQSSKALRATCHVDFPAWKKRTYEELPEADRPLLESVPLRPNTFAVFVLDQARPHMIPTTGDSKTVYVGAMSREQHASYVTATADQLAKDPPHRAQYLPLLRTLQDAPGVMTAFLMLTGTRPPLHPSHKPVVMPAPYNGSRYRLYGGYAMPPQEGHDIADVLCNLKRKHGASVHGPFADAARATKMQRCRLDPSALTTDALERYIGAPGTDIPIVIE